jgi:hypothetical protein
MAMPSPVLKVMLFLEIVVPLQDCKPKPYVLVVRTSFSNIVQVLELPMSIPRFPPPMVFPNTVILLDDEITEIADVTLPFTTFSLMMLSWD